MHKPHNTSSRTLWIHAGGTSRPKSSVWNSSADVARPLRQNSEEQAAVYKTARTALTAPVMSPRSPWLQPAALTADKFRQPRRHQSARLAEHAGTVMQLQVCKSGLEDELTIGCKYTKIFLNGILHCFWHMSSNTCIHAGPQSADAVQIAARVAIRSICGVLPNDATRLQPHAKQLWLCSNTYREVQCNSMSQNGDVRAWRNLCLVTNCTAFDTLC